jgi:alpha-amylase/alpha-mannosidase (GH57 family)
MLPPIYMTSEKFICIHGHFYQPPRENPWLEAVELQDSATPYHDWNERITYECYAPNAMARLMNRDGKITGITNNYSRISFNFGPTLLSWLMQKMPDIHQAIVDADKESRSRFSGHGSALAQCYNHIIMPLANRRDKQTQVRWGIRDFESRFGRKPEGMWLPETAADDESLDVLAENGIKFTVLSPFQASRVRPLAKSSDDKELEWEDVNGARVDPSMPYLVNLPSGRSIAVFFYDAPIAKAVAFEKLLGNGDHFAGRLMEAFDDSRQHDQVVNIATDGESYGHHFRHGDMALAYALHSIESKHEAKLTIYAEFLETHPPTHEAEIHQASAWSCSHGVGRWERDCGCSAGHAGWNQQWREPLRNALNQLRDQLAPIYEAKAREYVNDPWAARDDYIAVILDRSAENISNFFRRHGARELDETEQVVALRLLEMQRHAMLMFTSCGWFFDEISGIETVQVIQYATRAIQLAADLTGENIEAGFLEILEKAGSNIPENQNGRVVYERFAKPAVMTRESAAAHFAISSLFENYPEETRIYSFVVRQLDRQLFTAGNARLALGRIRVTFAITRASEELTYAVLHMGDHNANCGVKQNGDEDAYRNFIKEAKAEFDGADFPALIRRMDQHFGQPHYSLKNLFRDERQKVLQQILSAARDEINNAFRIITDHYSPMARFLADIHAPPLRSLESAMESVINNEIRRQFENGHLDPERVRTLVAEGRAAKIRFDAPTIVWSIKNHLDRLDAQLSKAPEDLETLQRLSEATALGRELAFEDINLWKPQNTYYAMRATTLPAMRERSDENAKVWVEKFAVLGERLGFSAQEEPPAK